MTFEELSSLLCQEHSFKPWEIGRLTRPQAGLYLRQLRDKDGELILKSKQAAEKEVRWDDVWRAVWKLRCWPPWRVEAMIVAERARLKAEAEQRARRR